MKAALILVFVSATVANGATVLKENFTSNPIGIRAQLEGNPMQFVYDNAKGSLTATYDLLKPHSRLVWPLSQAISGTDDFTVKIQFTLSSVHFDDFNFCQISFGLINQENTGSRRTIAPGNAWECLTVDYFPGASFPTLSPTFISRDNGSGNALTAESLKFPQGQTSLINDFGEIGSLPENTRLTTTLSYNAIDRAISLSVADQSGGLKINTQGSDPDNNDTTIQLELGDDYPFQFDAFALLLWEHNQEGSAKLTVHSILIDSTESNLINQAFPNGTPEPNLKDDHLTINYLRDLSVKGISVTAEESSDLRSWKTVDHNVISSGKIFELREARTRKRFLRLKVKAE